MWHAHVSWVSGTNLGSHELPQNHHHPIHQNNVSKFHYASITILHIKLPDTQVSQYYISSQLPIMLPVNQLCSWLPIMLLAIYAQNYASIIGKGLSNKSFGGQFHQPRGALTSYSTAYIESVYARCGENSLDEIWPYMF